jgi:Acyclic terpene utilisation family protein AtuA
MTAKVVRIGGASGYWGDSPSAPRQLVERADVDYLILDYLAEITMSILARARSQDPEGGYATDFITQVMKPLIKQIAAKRIKVIANAGGVNLPACRRALEQVAEEAGVRLRIGTVEGDDLMPRVKELRAQNVRELATGAPLPERLMSANAYLGAFPIAAALDAGADIVVTGRCVDSALAVGPLIHEFGWRPDDYDRLGAGALVGHVIECGAQATGGNFTDWEDVPDWDDAGFPIAEVRADGSFVLTKPEGTGGLVTPFTAGEQMLYELGDPAAYVLPDVVADFSRVTMKQEAENRVLIQGARGRAPTPTYKVSATYLGGFGCVGTMVFAGRNAVSKARRHGEAVLKKTQRIVEQAGLGGFAKTELQLVGSESVYGANARADAPNTREIVLRLGVHHRSRDAAEIFSKEFTGAGLSMAPGLTGLSPGRPRTAPIVRLYSFLIDKRDVPVSVAVDGKPVAFEQATTAGTGAAPASTAAAPDTPIANAKTTVPLYRLAVARSGDKGDSSNIGVIARKPEYLPAIRAALTTDAVARYFAHVARGRVERFDLPGIHALNFILYESLGGGGIASLNLDAQGKTYAQQLLDFPIPVPAGLVGD